MSYEHKAEYVKKPADKRCTADYTRRSIYNYQKRNRRLAVFVPGDLYDLYEEHVMPEMKFNTYVKTLMNDALETKDSCGKLGREQVGPNSIQKDCIISKELESAFLEKFAGETPNTRSLVYYVQWLIVKDLEQYK